MIYSEIRTEARNMLTGQWTPLVPYWFLYLLIMLGGSAIFRGNAEILGTLITWVLAGPMIMGMTKIFLHVYHKEPYELGQLFEGFKDFSRCASAYLLILLYVILWMLLLIVPGIIAGLGYSMTFFILAENPTLPASEAMRQSKAMMMGHKTDLFMLGLSFIGWAILATIPFGIGWLWLESYIYAAVTIFYHKIKGAEEIVVPQPEAVVEPEVQA
jgi:uncharacterized membrane protein